ncbi:MAG TPA: TIGR03619 family F420-dependent LLM class oxidoreductase [Acidimicrobiales bacterium]|nr:TIGR03619 family F420-dependent LLM class oxidoreductase [Acidimicrobiales bacterium]
METPVGVSDVGSRAGNRAGRWVVDAARLCERLGFSSFWAPQRVLLAEGSDEAHPYGLDREHRAMHQHGFFETFTSLAAMAAATSTLKLGSYVDLTGLRNPLVTAHLAATVDQISEGRLLYGCGVGWTPDEWAGLGVPWERRGARTTDYLRTIKAAWSGELFDHHGDFVDVAKVRVGPRPHQDPHPPILIGGNSQATIDRIVAVGDGWLGYGLAPADVQAFIDRLRAALAAAGRDPAGVSLRVGYRPRGALIDATPDELDRSSWVEMRDYIEACGAVGVDEVVISPRVPADGFDDLMAEMAGILGIEP